MDFKGEHIVSFLFVAGNKQALIVNVGALLVSSSSGCPYGCKGLPHSTKGVLSVGKCPISHEISIQVSTFLMTVKTQALYEVCLKETVRISK